MKLKYKSIGLVFVLLFTISGYGISTEKKLKNSVAANWPKYRGHNGDGISKETGLLKTWTEGMPKEVWRIPIGMGYSPIVVANGRVFTMDSSGDSEFLVSFDAANGQEKWRKKIGPIFKSSYGDGPRSCPLVDGKLYLRNQKEMVCLNLKNEKL